MKLVVAPRHMPAASAQEFLTAQFPDMPPGYLGQLLKKGKFRRLGEALAADTTIAPGDLVTLPGNLSFQQRAGEGSPAILFESETLLVVSKPASLAVHAGVSHRHDNLLARLAKTMRRRKAPYRLYPVHRLDRETTGALLLAKGKKSASQLGKLMMDGGIGKQYLALVTGELADRGELQTPVKAHGRLRAAASRYRTLAHSQGFSLLEIELLSGRTHQIRRQFAAAGAPLYGDRRYGERHPDTPSFYLHSRALRVALAESGEPLTVSAPLPEAMLETLARLGFKEHPLIPELRRYSEIEGAGLCKIGLTE